jgi:hypothetical protein
MISVAIIIKIYVLTQSNNKIKHLPNAEPCSKPSDILNSNISETE